MLTENDVIGAVTNFLQVKGYIIHQALNTSQQGIDIEAISSTGVKCFVEAKGATSSKAGTKRYGLEFNRNQVKIHIGAAMLKSFQTLQQYPTAEVAIALPGNETHFNVIDSISIPLKKSGIKVFMVSHSGDVTEYL